MATMEPTLEQLKQRIADLEAEVAALRVKWLRDALDVAMRETAVYHRTVITGRCIP